MSAYPGGGEVEREGEALGRSAHIWPALSASLRLSLASCLRSSISASIFSRSASFSLVDRLARLCWRRACLLDSEPSPSPSPLEPPEEEPLEDALSFSSFIFVISWTSWGMTTRCEVMFSRLCEDDVAATVPQPQQRQDARLV